jgi:hypothetical protein
MIQDIEDCGNGADAEIGAVGQRIRWLSVFECKIESRAGLCRCEEWTSSIGSRRLVEASPGSCFGPSAPRGRATGTRMKGTNGHEMEQHPASRKGSSAKKQKQKRKGR